ncbi:Cytochrome c oxidase polypeptide II [Thioalkalivibrio nitratireducens DSM 14787]|uniref:Cytochrome c oxidase subunit 2 n=1 Tax=Thioalkalivibrio nitratireducens (strain DSM 14787 / UNIQEM 213 / ALEN2) TaxID=1255043 RepID=L0E0C7_THIND|nr:Cytochrome c oxidase polypeptide II [Thioalkalivibrio nitratireducens DSM 14787]
MYGLHMLVFWICVAIGIVVFSAMFYSILRHRKSLGVKAARFHENTAVEVLWTLVPLSILVGMAIPATRVLIAMEDTSASDMTVKVTGYQWKWHYEYLDEEVSFFSNLATPQEQILGLEEKGEHYLLEVDNPMVVPVGKRIRILLTASDVIHAWWVPDLAIKRDAIPGFINEVWTRIDEPGVFRGQCAELCGRGHAFMPIVVVAKDEAGWQAWLEEQRASKAADETLAMADWSMDDLMARGREVHETHCAACHQAGGEGIPGVFPAIQGSAIATGALEEHLEIVIRGQPGTAMAAFGPQLSDADLASVITYQRNAWGNDTGDVVTPARIGSAR